MQENLTGKFWRLRYSNGTPMTELLSFAESGQVAGYHKPEMAFWRLQDRTLVIEDGAHEPTYLFEPSGESSSPDAFVGYPRSDPERKLVLSNPSDERPTHSETRAALGDHARRFGWSIGAHSYGSPNVIAAGMASLTIGKFCAIGGGTTIVLANHRVDLPSTYPFTTYSQYWTHAPRHVMDHTTKGAVEIGHDVWTGLNCFIGSGITIGSGAVVGAMAVVTADVPPYAIVAGNPARVLRYRFDAEVIEQLLDVSWWDLPDEVVDRLLPVMMGGDMQSFIEAARRAREGLLD